MRVFLWLLTLSSFSCTTIYFQNAQPEGKKDIDQFPSSIQGTYLMDGDTFEIKEKYYSFPIIYQNDLHLNEIDRNPNQEIREDRFYDNSIPAPDGIKFTQDGDTIRYRKHIRGSKFLNDTLRLRKIAGHYVLSERNDENPYWSVFILKKKGENLVVGLNGNLKGSEDEKKEVFDARIDDFSEFTSFNKLGPNTYLLDPDKRAFRKLLKHHFFSAELQLIRIEEAE